MSVCDAGKLDKNEDSLVLNHAEINVTLKQVRCHSNGNARNTHNFVYLIFSNYIMNNILASQMNLKWP